MKKIFTLIAAALMAVGAQAQDAILTFEEATASTGTFGSGDFTMTTVGWDGTNSTTSTRYFGTADSYVSAKGMIRAGNKIDGANRSLTIKSTYGGTVKFYMCTSSSTTEREVTVNGQTKSTSQTKATDNEERTVYGILEYTIKYGETAMTTNGDVYIYKVEFTSDGTVAPAEKETLLTYTVNASTPVTPDAEGDGRKVTIALDNGNFIVGNYEKILIGDALKAKSSSFTQEAGVLLDGSPSATDTKYVLVEMNTLFQAGDKIEIVGFRSGSSADIGISLYSDRAGENKIVDLPFATARYADNTVSYTVVANDNLVGKSTLYIRRIGSSSCYFHGITIKGDKAGRTTGIKTINAAQTAIDGVMYNLSGQKVNKSYKGVVIMDGKKMLNK